MSRLIDGEYKVKIILNKKGMTFEEDTNDIIEKKNGEVNFLVN
ncbi:Uncharacterised protein [Ewingella americana]|nr:Uncharacterised protein [Ewingella americana]